jgi:hypothetical protein
VGDVTGRRLVSDYLSRLQAAAWQLPADRRTALLDRVRRDLDTRLGADPDAAQVRTELTALGEPADVVAADVTARPVPPAAPPPRRRDSVWGSREVAAVLLLGVGGLALPALGPVVGLVLAWVAAGWTRAQKTAATVLAVVAPGVLIALSPALTGGWSGYTVVLLLPLCGLVPAGYLSWVLTRPARVAGHGGTGSG